MLQEVHCCAKFILFCCADNLFEEIIKEAYGCEIEELFDDFSELPIASGAIAQVHRAKLKINGLPVAVKVLHPGVQEIVDLDLHIMGIGAYLVRQKDRFVVRHLNQLSLSCRSVVFRPQSG
jgi:predicted unusual protein kinase regulating ubiquinone biosynthesis (AarF/ABC1/UbiB family)